MRNERGAALLIAIVALVAVGAMVAGTFLAGWLELRTARAGRNAVGAFQAAEAGAAGLVAAWSPTSRRLLIGVDTLVAADSSAGSGYAVTLSRIAESLFLIRAEGWQAGPGGRASRRMVGMFVRPVPIGVDHGAALTIFGPAVLASAYLVDGNDQVPPGWDGFCGGPLAVPAIRSTAGAGTAVVSVDSGAPAVVTQDSLLHQSALTDFGGVTFEDLAAGASHQVSGAMPALAPATVDGRCADAVGSNWGEPSNGPGSVAACRDFFPVVYAPASISFNGGRGQGILLVRGDLELAGGVEFTGVAVVLGRVFSSGAGGRIRGTLLVGGAGGVTTLGPADSVRYSSCAVERALLANGLRVVVAKRGWAQLY
jgi:Tfp pilus assembly protein PilX